MLLLYKLQNVSRVNGAMISCSLLLNGETPRGHHWFFVALIKPEKHDKWMIPKVRVLEDDEGTKDIELSDDPYDCMRLSVEGVPCIVTLSKIGHRHVVDATLQEEACSLASLLVAVNSKGTVTCIRKMGKGSLDPESIFEMIETGKRVTKSLHLSLQSTLNQEESAGKKRQKIGFLR
ncbi:exosome complex component RRP42-like [Hyperolius riggenbachi]|uniref:exosome complex component RRP42-like n=1 Tax=Hyperolius riggenbachi TaxID=752182 RepID=UPI0035A2CE46